MTTQPLVALVGNPNAGKSALFNALTGARQKLGNYPGVTVERKIGRLPLADGTIVDLVDLPGTYSLNPTSPDEEVTRNVILGHQTGERMPDALVIVVDAANLENHLRFTLELLALGLPTVVALNMVDLARRDGLELDAARLADDLGVPVIPTVAVRRRGLDDLRTELSQALPLAAVPLRVREKTDDFHALQQEAHRIARRAVMSESPSRRLTGAIDRVALHPVAGMIVLLTLLFIMFQAVFSWSALPVEMIEGGLAAFESAVSTALPEGVLRDFLVQGVIGGVGSVIVFLPQILILFFFILLLEGTGYMTRAAS
jgi:ferrous iron transport protein B